MTLKFDLILPKLLTDAKVYQINSKKFYNGSFCKVSRIISKNKDVSYVGNVVEIDNGLIVKWNRNRKDMYLLVNEIRYQRAMYCLGFAAKIREVYTMDKYVFIIMDNLCELGYKTIGELLYENYNKNYKKIIKNIALRINELHMYNIVHSDIHEYNIFYNIITDDVKFIDFADTIFVRGYLEAIELERYTYYNYEKFQIDIINVLEDIENLYLT